MSRMVQRRGAYRLIGLAACALLLACSDSHGPNAGSSGSNWLKCEKLADCAEAKNAVACSANGYCVDDEGEHIPAEQDPAPPVEMERDAGERISAEQDAAPPAEMERDAAAVMRESAGATGGPCVWSSDALLAQVGAKQEERINCGRYPYFDTNGVLGGFACLQDAVEQNRAVELSVNTCVDCYLLMTYVASTNRGLMAIRRERDSFGGDDIAEVSVQGCAGLAIEGGENPTVACLKPMDRYRCSEAADAVPEEEPQLPAQPLKLADVSAPGNVAREPLHLYVKNQTYTTGSAGIEVYIDDQHVVTGDFDVGGPRDWFETAIQVPVGSHRVRIWSPDGDTDLEHAFDIPTERWAVIEYWSEPPEEPYFTFNVHDQPVSFE